MVSTFYFHATIGRCSNFRATILYDTILYLLHLTLARLNTIDRSLSRLKRRPMVYSSFRLDHDFGKFHTRLRPKKGDFHSSRIGKNNKKQSTETTSPAECPACSIAVVWTIFIRSLIYLFGVFILIFYYKILFSFEILL